MQNRRIEILMATYNGAPYIREQLDSILAQTDCRWRLTVSDDGSTDGSSDLCDSFAEDNPAVVRVFHQDNKGLLRTRRVGISRPTT